MRSDVWDHVEISRLAQLLARRLKIISSANLKLIISILVQLQHLLLPPLIVTSSQVRVGMPLPLRSCCYGLGTKGLLHNWSLIHACSLDPMWLVWFMLMTSFSSLGRYRGSIRLPWNYWSWERRRCSSQSMRTIWVHWCWQRLYHHSLHCIASTMPVRQFAFGKRFTNNVSSYWRLTLLNSWVMYLPRGLSELCLNIFVRSWLAGEYWRQGLGVPCILHIVHSVPFSALSWNCSTELGRERQATVKAGG